MGLTVEQPGRLLDGEPGRQLPEQSQEAMLVVAHFKSFVRSVQSSSSSNPAMPPRSARRHGWEPHSLVTTGSIAAA
jgi:hypothetical protein